MLGLSELRQTRVYQEALEEGREEGRQEGRQEGREEGRQEGREEGRQEGREEGRQEGERSLIIRLLKRRLGALSESLQKRITALSVEQLDALAEALLDFESLADLRQWLQTHVAVPEKLQD